MVPEEVPSEGLGHVSRRHKVLRAALRFLAVIAGFGVIAWTIKYLAGEQEAWHHVLRADVKVLVLLIAVLFAAMVLNGVVTRDLVGHFGIRLRIREWLSISFVTSLFNYLTPFRGGAAVRAVYLKRFHGLAYAQFLSTMAAMVAGAVFVNATLAAVSLLLLGLPGGRSAWLVLLTCLGIMLAVILCIRFAPQLSRRKTGVVERVTAAVDGWQTICGNRALLLRLLLWTTLNALAHGFAFVLAFRMAGWQGHWLVAVVSACFAKIGSFVTLTPGSLGVLEAFGAVSARLIGGNLASALLAVLLIRVLIMSISIPIGALMFPLMFRRPTPALDREITQRYFNDLAEGFGVNEQSNSDKYEVLAGLMLPSSSAPEVLECGGGAGFYTRRLLEAGYRVTSIDLSKSALAENERTAREIGKHSCLTTMAGDFATLAGALIREYDQITFVKVFHHFDSLKDIHKALDVARQRCKKNGRIVVFEPNGRNPLWKIFLSLKKDKTSGKSKWYFEQNMKFTTVRNFRDYLGDLTQARIGYHYVLPSTILNKRFVGVGVLRKLNSIFEKTFLRRLAFNISVVIES